MAVKRITEDRTGQSYGAEAEGDLAGEELTSSVHAFATHINVYADSNGGTDIGMYDANPPDNALVVAQNSHSVVAGWNFLKMASAYEVANGGKFSPAVLGQYTSYGYTQTSWYYTIGYPGTYPSSIPQKYDWYTLGLEVWGYTAPVLSSIADGAGVAVGDTGVTLVGTDIIDDSGSGPVLQFANNNTFDDVVVAQSINSSSDTGINFDVVSTGLPTDTTIYARVISGYGLISNTYALTLSSGSTPTSAYNVLMLSLNF